MDNQDKLHSIGNISVILIVFSLLCFVTSFFMSFSTVLIKTNVSEKQSIVGPFDIKKSNTVINIKGKHKLSRNGAYNSLTIELLDSFQKSLYGFGDEMYFSSGRDSDGYWEESRKTVNSKMTIKKPGKYYLKITSSTNVMPRYFSNFPMTFIVTKHNGSSVPHFILGLFSFIGAIVIYEFFSGKITKILSQGDH